MFSKSLDSSQFWIIWVRSFKIWNPESLGVKFWKLKECYWRLKNKKISHAQPTHGRCYVINSNTCRLRVQVSFLGHRISLSGTCLSLRIPSFPTTSKSSSPFWRSCFIIWNSKSASYGILESITFLTRIFIIIMKKNLFNFKKMLIKAYIKPSLLDGTLLDQYTN